MRVLLIQPSIIVGEKYAQEAKPFLPVGLSSIAATLRAANHQVMLLDAMTEGWEFRWRHDGNWIEIGLAEEDVAAEIRRFQPHVVGFSIPFTTQMPRLRSLARWVKAIHPEIFVVCGGNYPTSAPREVLNIPEVDLVVIGEGEAIFPRILERLAKGLEFKQLNGVAYRDSGGGAAISSPIRFIENLDQLPPPAYDLLPLQKYFKAVGKRSMPVFTTRGCAKKCTYCTASLVHGKKNRSESVQSILTKIVHLNEFYGVSDFVFDDHNLFSNGVLVNELFDRIISENLKIQWTAKCAVDPGTLDEALLTKMRQAGGKRLCFFPDSGSRKVLRNYLEHSFDPFIAERVIQRALQSGLKVSCHFLLGSPGETYDELYETLNFAWKLRSLGVDEFDFSLAVPYAGSAMRIHAENMQCILPQHEQNYTPFDGCVETSEIPVQDLMRIRATAQKEFNNVGLISGLKHRFVPRGPMMQVPEERFFSSVAPKQIMLEKAPVSDHHDEIMETV